MTIIVLSQVDVSKKEKMDTRTLYLNVQCSKYEFFNNDIYNNNNKWYRREFVHTKAQCVCKINTYWEDIHFMHWCDSLLRHQCIVNVNTLVR